MKNQPQTVNDFYPEYLNAHQNKVNKILHFIGATLFFVCIAIALVCKLYFLIVVGIFIGYILPGIGHHYYENNKSFRVSKPLLCVACAAKMYFQSWIKLFKK